MAVVVAVMTAHRTLLGTVWRVVSNDAWNGELRIIRRNADGDMYLYDCVNRSWRSPLAHMMLLDNGQSLAVRSVYNSCGADSVQDLLRYNHFYYRRQRRKERQS